MKSEEPEYLQSVSRTLDEWVLVTEVRQEYALGNVRYGPVSEFLAELDTYNEVY